MNAQGPRRNSKAADLRNGDHASRQRTEAIGKQPADHTLDSSDDEAEAHLLSIAALAAYLGVPQATIYWWRSRGDGPPGFRLGKHLRFRQSEIEAWLETRRDSTAP
jgi:excisionase family DNA binding protein